MQRLQLRSIISKIKDLKFVLQTPFKVEVQEKQMRIHAGPPLSHWKKWLMRNITIFPEKKIRESVAMNNSESQFISAYVPPSIQALQSSWHPSDFLEKKKVPL